MSPWRHVYRRAAREAAVALVVMLLVRYAINAVRMARHIDGPLPRWLEVTMVCVPIVAALFAAVRARRATQKAATATVQTPTETFRTTPRAGDELDERLDEELARMSDRPR